jgi:hypothetical protein
MPIPSSISDLNTNPALNSPAGSDSPTQGDDFFRAHAAIIKSLDTLSTTGAYPSNSIGRHIADELWNPCDAPWGAPTNGTTDATTAVQTCITDAAAAGRGVLIPCYFSVNSLSIPSKSYLHGVGVGKCGFKQISGANDAIHLADPGSSSTYTSNVTIEDLTFQGTVLTDAFQEVLHLFFTQGCSDLTIQRCEFRGWRGDAIYIGTGNERGQNPTQIRHNRGVKIVDCTFDGEAKDNRNCISIIDCDGGWFQRLVMRNFGRSDMPAGIDIEPDSGGGATFTASFSASVMTVSGGVTGTIQVGMTVTGVGVPPGTTITSLGTGSGGTGTYNLSASFSLSSSTFAAGTGEASILRNLNFSEIKVNDYSAQAAYAINLPNNPSRFTVPISNIVFDCCDAGSSAASYGQGFSFLSTTQHLRTAPELGVHVRSCSTLSVYQPFAILGVRGVNFSHNQWGTSSYSCQVGESSKNALDFRMHGDYFYRVGYDNTVGGTGLFIYGADGVFIDERCVFDDCGKENKTYNANIALDTAATHSNIWILDALFVQPSANPNAYAVRRDAGVLSAGTTRYERPTLINIGGGSVSFRHDYIPATNDESTPTLLNSWVAYGAPFLAPSSWKDSAGNVHLQGSIKSGTTTAGTVILTLGAAYRPTAQIYLTATQNTGVAVSSVQLLLMTNGDIQTVNVTSNNLLSLDGITFRGEA